MLADLSRRPYAFGRHETDETKEKWPIVLLKQIGALFDKK